ncbi:MAG: PKD domain-containing protein [Gemmatimonadota bacterium]|nr:MAG: PKD domain-containing protein [Gemmatimonadota bacterium]
MKRIAVVAFAVLVAAGCEDRPTDLDETHGSSLTLSGDGVVEISSTVIDGETGCLAVGGAWSSGTCTISALDIPSGVTITIAAGIRVVVAGYLTNGGTISNSGSVDVADAATFTNDGFVENFDGATIQNATGSTGSTIVNGSEGHIVNHAGAELLNGAGCATCVIGNSGVIDNAGRFESEDAAVGEVLNEGTINDNGGLLRIGTGSDNRLTNAGAGVINNDAAGYIVIVASGTQNSGVINNGGTFSIGETIELTNDGTINNSGTFTIEVGAQLTNNGTIYNACGATFENNGVLLGNPVEFEVCPPELSVESALVSVYEAQTAINGGTVSDPDNDPVILTASIGVVSDNGDGTWSWEFQTTDGPDESQTVFINADDGTGGTAQVNFALTVTNVAPTVVDITVPVSVVPLGTPIDASAEFTDPGTADTHTAVWNWGDGTSDGPDPATSPTPASHTYAEVGLYTIELRVTDDDGDSDTQVFESAVVYDPIAGFVTGGGWIHSPAGAYKPDPSLTGRANFGFVAKYKRGADVPTGQTEFQLRVANLNFHSTSYDWLIVTGGNYVRFQGSGTINGTGEYKFMLWAGGDDPDTFRIKIWEEDEEGVETVTYDNGMDQSIGGGNITIHK